MTDNPENIIREEWIPEAEWCEQGGISYRTSKRQRDEGLPWMRQGRIIWIHREGGKKFLRDRMQSGKAVR